MQGQADAAQAAIRYALNEAHDRATRAQVLPSYIEIMLAADDVHAARAGADELSKIAIDIDAPLLYATSACAQGAVLFAEGEVHAALDRLAGARVAWSELAAPYETARVRVLIGLARLELGDDETAHMDLDAALAMFRQLGAAPDLARVNALVQRSTSRSTNGLTGREVEVLALVATGKTNREIAADLVISEKTVARHVSNIFTKLGVTSRAGATAYAFKHDLA